MAAYVLALVDVRDPEAYKQYVAGVEATVTAHGGRFLARVPGPEVLEGGPAPGRAVILEFPSLENARAWYNSDAYAPLIALRQKHSRATILLLPGYAPK